MVGNISITDMYMSVLSSLSVDEKLDLIAKLTNSGRNTSKQSYRKRWQRCYKTIPKRCRRDTKNCKVI